MKVRRQRVYDDSRLHSDDLAFVRTHAPVCQALLPQAWIDYRRITLLSLRSAERVTIDIDLSMTRISRAGYLPDVAIVEVKQSHVDRRTAVMTALHQQGWREGWASKYCAAIAFTLPDVRANRFVEGIRALGAVSTWAN